MRRPDGHAVVLGGGIAGLLAARVLADAYERVTVVERDTLPPAGEGRRGVPQGRHTHLLMPRGMEVVEGMFPGFADDLVAAGGVRVEPLADFRLQVNGHVLRQAPAGATAVQASRPFLEGAVRDRVLRLAGVDVVTGCDAVGLVAGDTPGTVNGARIVRRAPGSAGETLAADLVVDAMGRGGRTPTWLADLGYPGPPEDEFPVDVGYATRCLRLEASDSRRLEAAVGVGAVPGRPRGMMMLEVEGGRRMLTLLGVGPSHRPPTDPDAFLAFAATVAPPDVLAAIGRAESIGRISAYRYPSYLRRHYQRLRRFPDGLLVTGDALCSFSPVYAQGMTVAALEAEALRRCLEAGPGGLARRFFRATSRIVADPWRAAVASDLALPEVAGRRGVAVRLQNAYLERVLAAAEHDDAVACQFMRVTGMLDPPARLFRPSVLRRVLGGGPRAAQHRAGIR
jgi:2-polyprenyl-6-methoxyphenol hydroxylase-like FAD-dependent oxidoreductase